MNKGKNLKIVCSGIADSSAMSSKQLPLPNILKQHNTLCSNGIRTDASLFISKTLAALLRWQISSNKAEGTLLLINSSININNSL